MHLLEFVIKVTF